MANAGVTEELDMARPSAVGKAETIVSESGITRTNEARPA